MSGPVTPNELSRGARGDGVCSLQCSLVETGFDVDVDGRFEEATETAVASFQRHEGLPPTGRADDATRRLLAARAESIGGSWASAPPDDPDAWDTERLVLMNPAGRGQAVSPLEHLMRVGAASPDLLCNVSSRFEETCDAATVICFGQLPFPLPGRYGDVVLEGCSRGVSFAMSLLPGRIGVDLSGTSVLHAPPKLAGRASSSTERSRPMSNGVSVTQIVGRVELWGRRQRAHSRYEEHLTEEGLLDGIVVDHGVGSAQPDPQGREWRTPMNAEQFEVNVSRRLAWEFRCAVVRVLSASERVGLSDAGVRDTLLGYFLMPAPGRVTFHDPPQPTLAFAAREQQDDDRSALEQEIASLTDRLHRLESFLKSARGRGKVFLSHSHGDKPVVEKVKQYLESRGVPTWYDADQLDIGDNLMKTITDAIDGSVFVCVFLSRQSIESRWVQHELDLALRQVHEAKSKFLPVKLDDLPEKEIPGHLSGLLWGDLREGSQAQIERLGEQLIRAIARFDGDS